MSEELKRYEVSEDKIEFVNSISIKPGEAVAAFRARMMEKHKLLIPA